MKRFSFRRRQSRWTTLFDCVAVLVAVIVLTLAVMPNVLHASAYFDEGYSAFLARFDILTMAGYTALDVHPPLYYAVLHFWGLLFGQDLVTLRMLSVVFGWSALTFGFLFVRRAFGSQAARVAVILMALSPLFIRYGASMRMYTMALTLAFAGSYVLLRAVQTKTKKWWIIYGLIVSAGMWTNYFMALVWITHLLWLLYEYRSDAHVMKAWRYAVIGAIVLYLPWLPWLLFRYGEIQASGFWIKPVSMDTLASTISMSLIFRTSAQTTAWLAVAIIAFIAFIVVAGRKTYVALDGTHKRSFRLLLAMSSLPFILLVLGSMPPLRSSYVYRYVLVVAVASSLLIGVIATYVRFKRHDAAKRVALYALIAFVFACGAIQAVITGNRNLDTDSQNKLGQVIADATAHDDSTPIVIRSPYSYYAGALYQTKAHHVYFIYNDVLASIGSTKPLFDHHEDGVRDFSGFQSVWIVGEDRGSVSPPTSGAWAKIHSYIEYDDVTKKPAAFATLYRRVE